MAALLEAPVCVYVVDDDRDTTECMRLLLEIWGHDVHVANGGAMAIEQAPHINPDLMMVDLAMPRIDGLEVARRIRQYRELDHTSLVAVSGYAGQHHRELALAAGFDECFIKPVPAEHVLALLERVRRRIEESKRITAKSAEAVAISRARKAKSLQPPQSPASAVGVPVRLQKSGISDVVCLSDRAAAERLRQWLKERGCRVGPVFEQAAGQWAFFNYSRRQLRSVIGGNNEFSLQPPAH
jgi:CheY-like chemotaxis protein